MILQRDTVIKLGDQSPKDLLLNLDRCITSLPEISKEIESCATELVKVFARETFVTIYYQYLLSKYRIEEELNLLQKIKSLAKEGNLDEVASLINSPLKIKLYALTTRPRIVGSS